MRSRGGSLFNGLVMGLLIGLLLAAGLAWYLNSRQVFKPAQPEPATPTTPNNPSTPAPQTAVTPTTSAPAKMDYTFYGILPGEKPAKPVEPTAPTGDIWWLQVAALKSPADADRLKARLSLLGLQVVTQKIHANNQALYRVRVGPYKRQDDAVADIDTLAENKIEHKLLKEPPNP